MCKISQATTSKDINRISFDAKTNFIFVIWRAEYHCMLRQGHKPRYCTNLVTNKVEYQSLFDDHNYIAIRIMPGKLLAPETF